MPKVALVETKPSRTNFAKEFDGAFEFDQYQLCSDPSIKISIIIKRKPITLDRLYTR